MLTIKEVIVVEGKYDKIKLDSLVDTLIIPVNGFGIYKDKPLLDLLESLARTRGLLILTDSDAAGFQIRNAICARIDKKYIKHAYIPDIYGKEKRKSRPSCEGKLGVEGIGRDALLDAVRQSGCGDFQPPLRFLDHALFYQDGFAGGAGSAARRKRLCERMKLPERLPAKRLIDVLNIILTAEEYNTLVNQMKAEEQGG